MGPRSSGGRSARHRLSSSPGRAPRRDRRQDRPQHRLEAQRAERPQRDENSSVAPHRKARRAATAGASCSCTERARPARSWPARARSLSRIGAWVSASSFAAAWAPRASFSWGRQARSSWRSAPPGKGPGGGSLAPAPASRSQGVSFVAARDARDRRLLAIEQGAGRGGAARLQGRGCVVDVVERAGLARVARLFPLGVIKGANWIGAADLLQSRRRTTSCGSWRSPDRWRRGVLAREVEAVSASDVSMFSAWTRLRAVTRSKAMGAAEISPPCRSGP